MGSVRRLGIMGARFIEAVIPGRKGAGVNRKTGFEGVPNEPEFQPKRGKNGQTPMEEKGLAEGIEALDCGGKMVIRPTEAALLIVVFKVVVERCPSAIVRKPVPPLRIPEHGRLLLGIVRRFSHDQAVKRLGAAVVLRKRIHHFALRRA